MSCLGEEMALWKKIGCIVGGSVVTAGAVVAAPFIATTATAIAIAVGVGGTFGAIASAFLNNKNIKYYFLMQGGQGSGKTTIIDVLIDQSNSENEATGHSMSVEKCIEFNDMGFLDVAANDKEIKEIFSKTEVKAKKIILYIFNAKEYLDNKDKAEEIQKATKYYQIFCENKNISLFAVGTYGDYLSDEEKKTITKELSNLSLGNSNKTRVSIQIICAKKKIDVSRLIKGIRKQLEEKKVTQ